MILPQTLQFLQKTCEFCFQNACSIPRRNLTFGSGRTRYVLDSSHFHQHLVPPAADFRRTLRLEIRKKVENIFLSWIFSVKKPFPARRIVVYCTNRSNPAAPRADANQDRRKRYALQQLAVTGTSLPVLSEMRLGRHPHQCGLRHRSPGR